MKYLIYISVLLCAMGMRTEKTPRLHRNNPQPGIMVKIPAGYYTPFYQKNGVSKKVFVKSFYMDVYAVTNAEFLQFVKANPQWAKSKISRIFADTNYLIYWAGDFNIGPDFEQIKNSPVTNISWFAANAYAQWKNKRLPTTAEWEYAASAHVAGTKTTNSDTLTTIVLRWYEKPNTRLIPNVGTTFENSFGLYDMFGLVWEWVFDFNVPTSSADAAGKNLFCASASLNSANKKDYASFMRYALRNSLKGNYCENKVGFRCAKDNTQK